jgi:dTDP-glucose pyrophosphorylase
MLEVGGRPFIEFILAAFRAAEVRDILIVTGYRAEAIETHLGDGRRWGLRLSYVRQAAPRGTGAAALLAREFVGSGPFLLSWSDILCRPEHYRGVREKLESSGADGVVAVNWTEDPCSGAAVYLAGDRLTGIVEKPPPGTSRTPWNQAGLFAFRPNLFEYLARTPVSPRGEVELTSAEQAMLADGRDLRSYEITGRRWSLGTPAELEALRAAAERGHWPD